MEISVSITDTLLFVSGTEMKTNNANQSDEE